MMFAEMRRQDRLLSREETDQILARCGYGVLSMQDVSGYPYGVPVNYVYANGKLYVHCARNAGQKAENLKRDDRVCFTVVGSEEVMPEKFGAKYESVVAFGRARQLDGDEKQAAMEAFIDKFCADYRAGGLKYIAGTAGRREGSLDPGRYCRLAFPVMWSMAIS